MSTPSQETQIQPEAQKANDVESNLVKQRKHYERQLEQERMARQQAEERIAALEKSNKPQQDEDDDDDSEPYIDKKRLQKTLNRVIPKVQAEAKQDVRQEVQRALSEERRANWMKNNSDFQEVMSHAQAFAEKYPEEAETILEMPEGFERQKLVYHAIKRQSLHKKEEPKPSIQDKVDANRRSPYYQPSGMGAAPYAAAGDYSPAGQKNAYAKMQELKSKLRIWQLKLLFVTSKLMRVHVASVTLPSLV